MGEIIVSELTENQIDRINVILNEVPAPKPVEQKIIDLSKCINTIDMEFVDRDEEWTIIGKLAPMLADSHYPYLKIGGVSTTRCRVRQNHIHYYDGKGNPLPDGLLVRVYFLDYDNMPPYDAKSQNINWDGLYNVKGFQVIDTLPEYKYGWEK